MSQPYPFEYECCECHHEFNDENIIAGREQFESLSPCCKSEDFALTKAASDWYKSAFSVKPITARPASTFNLEEEARRMILRLSAEDVQ